MCLIRATQDLLRQLDSSLEYHLVAHPESDHIVLPPAPGADYQFEVGVERGGDGEPQIHATFVAPHDHSKASWYWPCEMQDYASVEERDSDYLSTLEKILTHRTRILHKRGFLFDSFICQCDEAHGWERIGPSMFIFRGTLARRARFEYRSEPLARTSPRM